MSQIRSEDFTEIIPETQYPETISICSAKQWKQNAKCIFLTIAVIVCLGSTCWCQDHITTDALLRKTDGSKCTENVRWLMICTSIIVYTLYLMECSHAIEKIELCNSSTISIQNMKTKIEIMKNSLPIIWWRATCYHYERRKRRTTQYRRGTYFVATRIYQDRVNSISASSTFNYSFCGMKDISNSIIMNRRYKPVIKFRLSKGFAFANMAAAAEFETQRSSFFRELQRYDEYMEVHEGLDLTDFTSFKEEETILNTPGGKRPWFANYFYYWIYSCFLLSWPFRLYLMHNTAYVHYKITKLFGTNYENDNTPSSIREPDTFNFNSPYSAVNGPTDELTPLSADISNISSTDLVHNTTLAPSYSEALLIDGHPTTTTPIERLPCCSNSISIEFLNNEAATKPILNQQRNISRSSTIRRYLTRSFSLNSDDNLEPLTESQINLSEDHPPTYEEALMLPVIGRLRDETNLSSPTNAISLALQQRPSNPRTLLSIETSL